MNTCVDCNIIFCWKKNILLSWLGLCPMLVAFSSPYAEKFALQWCVLSHNLTKKVRACYAWNTLIFPIILMVWFINQFSYTPCVLHFIHRKLLQSLIHRFYLILSASVIVTNSFAIQFVEKVLIWCDHRSVNLCDAERRLMMEQSLFF